MTVELAVAVTPGDGPDQVVEQVVTAERLGLDAVVVRDDGGADPWTALVWAAAATRRIHLVLDADATVVALPSMLAKQLTSLAALSDGRAEVVLRGEGAEDLATTLGASVRDGLADREPTVWVARGELLVDEDRVAVTGSGDAGRVVEDVRRTGAVRVVTPVTGTAELEAFGTEVAPAVRSVLGAGAVPQRRATVRARRREGIDYDGVPRSLADTAIEPGDPGYRRVRSNYLRGGAPGLVLLPRDAGEVADAVAFAQRHRHLPLGVRSGGHGVSGRSTNDGGLVIDLRRLDRVDVLDPASRRVRVGPGATWKQVAAALGPHGWALGSGDYGGVGVGGLATAGGIGFLSREQGLTIDRLRTAELVLADGSLLRVSETEHPDLFWAVRGAGANFGVVTAFEFEAEEVAEVGFAQLTVAGDDAVDLLLRFGEVATAAPRDTTVFLVTGPTQHGRIVAQLYGMVDSADPDVIVERLQPFASLGRLLEQRVVLARYSDVMGMAADVGPDGHRAAAEPVSRSGFAPALTPQFARDAAALLESGVVHFFQLRTTGGAIADVPSDATAYAHRDAAFQVTALGADTFAVDAGWGALAPHLRGLYLSFETDQRPERLADAFPPATLERLRALKHRYDPDNLFHDNFNLTPEVSRHA